MNVSELLSSIYGAVSGVLVYVIPLLIISVVIKTAWFKGVMGEFIVNLCLSLLLSKKDYTLIKNVTLPTKDGTTQIDHVVVSEFGVFVIETKNMKGWIFGSARQKQWTQKIFKHTNTFQNPLHQNYKHIKTLEGYLKINPKSLHSVIVFVGESTFKTDMPENVTYASDCVTYIKSKKVRVFTANDVARMIKRIDSKRLDRGLITNLEHTANVKRVVKEKSGVKGNKACPKCGSAMVLRQSKKGEYAGNNFFGCSTFPKCRAIVNAD